MTEEPEPTSAPSEGSIHARIVAILAELPPIGKDQRNEQQNFMFRGHDDVLNALNPLLAKHGVFPAPDVLERIVEKRQTRGGAVMYEVNLHVRYRFYGANGDFVEASTWGEGTDMGDKATSKAMTMAFKSALNQVFAISNKEVTDADAGTAEETVVQRELTEDEKRRNRIERIDALIAKVAEAEGMVEVEFHDELVLEHGVFDELSIDALNDLGLALNARLAESEDAGTDAGTGY